MRNYRGELAECTTANLFIVKDGAALTPPARRRPAGRHPHASSCSTSAVMSASASLNRCCEDEDLFGADEAFLTSTTREICARS
jgi:hypothetical protein